MYSLANLSTTGDLPVSVPLKKCTKRLKSDSPMSNEPLSPPKKHMLGNFDCLEKQSPSQSPCLIEGGSDHLSNHSSSKGGCRTSRPSSMDPNLRALLKKYIRWDYVINSLELAGFDSPPVLMCLNDENVKQLEDYIISACAVMDSHEARQYYLGPIFAQRPSSFRLPAGVLCGLRLVIDDLKRIEGQQANFDPPSVNGICASVSSSHLRTPSSTPGANFDEHVSESNQYGLSNAITQTELSIPTSIDSGNSTASNSIAETNLSSPHHQSSDHSVSPHLKTASSALCATKNADNLFSAASDILTASSKTVQSAAVEESALIGCKRLLDGLINPCGTNPSNTRNALALPPIPTSFSQSALDDDSVIDVNRLIEHSAASACRLAARQFVSGNLVRGHDFDMEMEINPLPNGQKRVTGIFYCHLCRERRERTCPVRFSIARNRYPVMSNVISHLKTHFQYRAVGSQSGLSAARRTNGVCSTNASGVCMFPSSPSSPPSSPSSNEPAAVGLSPVQQKSICPSLSTPSNAFLTTNSLCDFVSQVVHFASTAPSSSLTANGLLPSVVRGCETLLPFPPITNSIKGSSTNSQPR